MGSMFCISTDLFTVNHQYLLGRSDDLSQFLVMVTVVCQALSTSQFWCWQYGGVPSSSTLFSSSMYSATRPCTSFASKSVQNFLGWILQSLKNFLIAWSSEVLRFFSGCMYLYLVTLSTSSRVYLIPPIVVHRPNPISICQRSLSACLCGTESLFFMLLGCWQLHLDLTLKMYWLLKLCSYSGPEYWYVWLKYHALYLVKS